MSSVVETGRISLNANQSGMIDNIGGHDIRVLEKLKDGVNIRDSMSVMNFGAAPMADISKFSDSLLGNIKGKDSAIVGEQLKELITKVKVYQPLDAFDKSRGFLQSLPLFGRLFGKVQEHQIDNMTLAEQVDTIASHLEHSMIGLLRDIEKMEVLYQKNLEHYLEVDRYVQAGKMKIRETQDTELLELQQRVNSTNDLLDAQRLKDLLDDICRFERRIHDLELSKTISMQTAPQIRIIQNNNQQLAEKISNSIMTTLPIWKSQMVLSASLDEQARAVALQKDVSETTNKLLRKNAEMLQQNSIATAREAERALVDIDTMREVQSRLVNTIEETMKIAVDAKVERKRVEAELATMEDNLKAKITQVIENHNRMGR